MSSVAAISKFNGFEISAFSRGDAVGAGLNRQQRRTHRIGPRTSPCIAKCSDVVDVHTET